MSFAYKRRAQYYETDQMAIVHHSNYIRWVEEARVAFLRSIGCPCGELEDRDGIIIPVTDVSAKYLISVRFEDEVVIDTKIIAYNGVRLRLGYEIRFADSGRVAARLESGHCFVDRNHRPMSLKRKAPALHALLASAVEPAEA